jgi:hypothetical protein
VHTLEGKVKAGGEGDLVPMIFGCIIGGFVFLLTVRFGGAAAWEYMVERHKRDVEAAAALAASREATLAKIRERVGPPEERPRRARRGKKAKGGKGEKGEKGKGSAKIPPTGGAEEEEEGRKGASSGEEGRGRSRSREPRGGGGARGDSAPQRRSRSRSRSRPRGDDAA